MIEQSIAETVKTEAPAASAEATSIADARKLFAVETFTPAMKADVGNEVCICACVCACV